MDDKEPKIIIDDNVMDDDSILDADPMEDGSFGDDIIEGEEEWSLDDLDDLNEEDIDGSHDQGGESKRKMMLMAGVAGVVVLIGGGIFFTQMGSSSNETAIFEANMPTASPVALTEPQAPTTDNMMAQQPNSEQSIQSALNATQSTQSDGSSLLDDMDGFESLLQQTQAQPQSNENTQPQPEQIVTAEPSPLDDIFADLDADPQGLLPMPAPISTDIQNDTPNMAGDEVAMLEEEAAPAPVENTDMVDDLLTMPEPVTSQAITDSQTTELPMQAQPLVPTASNNDAVDQRFGALEDKIDEMTAAMSTMMAQLEQMADQSTTATVAPARSDSNETVAQLVRKIDQLENRINTLSRPATTAASNVTRAAPAKAPSTARKTTRTANPNKVNTQWVLRGATPGEALIAHARSGSVMTVKPGERLAGIGTVRSITQQNGQWVVQGSTGRIIH